MTLSHPPSVDAILHALSTDVSLLRIFRHLGVKDLLSCRFVNQKWTKIAGIVLKSRSTFIAHKKLYKLNASTAAADYTPEEALWINLGYLSHRIRTNPDFPFLGFTIFNSERGLTFRIIEDFSRSNGHHFKRLFVDLVDVETVTTALGHWFQNIDELIIGRVDTFTMATEDEPEEIVRVLLDLNNQGISLPNLRRLILPPLALSEDEQALGQMLGRSVIEAAPKITKIKSFHPALTDAVISHGKVAAVSSLFIRPGYVRHMEAMEKLSQSGRKLTSLELDCDFYHESPLAPSIINILESSRDSLERLRTSCFSTTPPTMWSMKTLWMVDWSVSDDDDPAAPRWLVPVNTYWPALETVRLDMMGFFDSSAVRSRFSSDELFISVNTLEILCAFDQGGLSALAEKFPNLSRLRVNLTECFRSGEPFQLCDLWTIPLELKELEIYNYSTVSDLDSFLTGYSSETCDKLRQLPKQALEPKVLDAFRTKPSVVQMKGLEKLTIFFTSTGSHDIPKVARSASPIFNWYALELMPSLRTRFQYDFHAEHAPILAKALEPYSDFVSLEHRWAHEVSQLFE